MDKILRDDTKSFAEFVKADIDGSIAPLNTAVDALILRLEECETMLSLIQQERCSAIGITGALTEAMDCRPKLTVLKTKIDAVEKVTAHLERNLEHLEAKMSTAEEQAGIVDTSTKLKSFIFPLLNLRGSADKATTEVPFVPFITSDYFKTNSKEDSDSIAEEKPIS